MTNIPFPDHIAAPFVERIRREYEARKARELAKLNRMKRKERERHLATRDVGRVGGQTTERDWLGYRLPNGRVLSVYDPYRPTYPEGAQPGWVDVTRTRRFYANESYGYEYRYSNFRPLEMEPADTPV